MNKAQKGKRIEREFELKLQALGYVTHKAISSRFNRNDIFGCWDLMAKHPQSPTITLYFQLSTQWKYGKARKELEAFPMGAADRTFMVKWLTKDEFLYLEYALTSWELKQKGWLPISEVLIFPVIKEASPCLKR